MSSGDQRRGARHLVIVEDEPSLLAATAMLLELEGYRVTPASDGRAALELLGKERPDLVITDYMMPYVDGLELVRRIRTDKRLADLPVLLMSAVDPPEPPADAKPDAFLSKSTDMDEMLAVIGALLAGRYSGDPE